MSSIDQRIVQMQFDNKSFEGGIKTTLNSLKNLDEKLKMKSSTDGLSNIEKGLGKLKSNGLAGVGEGVASLTAKFSALGVIGVTALANITNRAVDAGTRIVKSLTIDPIKTGFQEYETKINSIQTILTNTAHAGTTLDQVTKALNELNDYSDKTIYNFAEMTKNIGTFTAAGIDLDTSVASIKGIANLAAGSGSTPQQAATAMYQLSQALAAGKVNLQDWNSVVNAGMGGKLFQDALTETAKGMGKVIDTSKPFRESLQDGWLTADVLTTTLTKFAEDESLVKAATEVKTLTQLMGVMAETVQSGWAQTWEAIIGDKEQASQLFTSISDGFSALIQPSMDARNAMFEFWNEAGGRDDMIKGFTNIISTIGDAFKPIGEAFREIFPPMTGQKLVDITKGFLNLTEKFKISDKAASAIKNTFKGVFSVIDLGITGVKNLFSAFSPVTSIFASLGGVLLNVTSSIGNFFSAINKGAKDSGIFEKISNGISNGIKGIDSFISNVGTGISNMFKALSSANFKPVFDFFSDLGGGLGTGIAGILEGIGKALSTIDFNVVFGTMGTLLGASVLKNVANVGKVFKEAFGNIAKAGDSVTGILDGVKGSLQAYQNDLNAGILIKLAAAIGILSLSLGLLAGLDQQGLETALVGITMLMIELIAGMAALLKIASTSNLKGFFSISTALVTLSIGILLLASAMRMISGLSWQELITGLVGLAGVIGLMAGAVKLLEGKHKGLTRTAGALVVLGTALIVLTQAVKMMGSLDLGSLAKGLVGVGVLLGELALFLTFTNFGGMSLTNSAGLLVLAAALNVLSIAVNSFGSMNTGSLIQGLVGVGLVLAQLTVFMKLLGNGTKIFSTAASLVVLGVALNIVSKAIESMGNLSWEQIGKGLLTMASSLAILGVAATLIPGGSLIATGAGVAVMAGALIILSSALQSMGSMSWGEIAKSLVTLAGSLTILAVAMAFMTTGIAGAGAMMLMSAALMLFVPQLVALSNLSLTQVGIGLLALAGAFTVIGLAGLILTPLLPVLAGLAGVIALLGAGCMAAGVGVSLLATAFAAFGAAVVGSGLGIVEVIRQLIGLLPTLGKNLAGLFTSFLTTIAKAMPEIKEAFSGILTNMMEAIISAIPKITQLGIRLLESFITAIATVIPKVIELGVNLILALLQGISSNIGRFITVATDIVVNFINGLASNIGRIVQAGVDMAITLVNGLANGIASNTGPVINAGMNLVLSLVNAIGQAVGRLMNSGKELVNAFVQGFMQGKGQSQTAGSSVAQSAVTGAKSGGTGMSSVGSFMIQGLIGGIKSMASSVATAAKNVVSGAVNAAKSALKIHSPSRVFMEIGKWTVLGFSNGLRDNTEISNRQADDLANQAINNMMNPLSKLKTLLDGNIDNNPTITPVLNLDKVKEGSSKLKDLFKDEDPIDVGGGVGSGVLSKTIRNVQNGNDNSDVVSELKSLKKEINKVKGTTNVINGVTYDDGSNVNDAVETIVHAAKIERRI